MGIPSPGNKKWTSTPVERLLKDEFHTGKITFKKFEYITSPISGKLEVNKRPQEKWITGMGKHEKLKTVEEHLKILLLNSPARSLGGGSCPIDEA